MRLEEKDGKVLVWETGMQVNSLLYSTGCDLSKISRREICSIEDFLRENNKHNEADILKLHIGKVLRYRDIPKLIPVNNYRVDVGLGFLERGIESYINEYGLDLNPDFQRSHVWSMEQRVAFVEFIVQGGATNYIYFNHTEWKTGRDGEMVIVDGLQRLTSLLMFVRNEMPIFRELDKDDNVGFYFKDFDLMRHRISIIINDLPTRRQILEWYLQMNKGNVAHTKEELDKVESLLLKETVKEI